MRNANVQLQWGRQRLQRFLEHRAIGGITAAAIAEDEQPAGFGIVPTAVPLPPLGNAGTAQFAGSVAGIEVYRAFVPRQIIAAMRDQFPAAGAGKVMIQSVDRRLRGGVTIAGEITQQFFLFGIDAEHGIACAQIRVFEPGNVFELGIAVRVGNTFFLRALLHLTCAFSTTCAPCSG